MQLLLMRFTFKWPRSDGQSLYVDEINWWPLTFSLKCRQLVASDASFVAPSKEKIDTCSTREPNQGVPQRFKSYDWTEAKFCAGCRVELPRFMPEQAEPGGSKW